MCTKADDVEFLSAKNGQMTCRIKNIFLHSAYNPDNEANNFVNNIECDFNPSCIIIIEPALSYCEKFLRKRFKNSKLYAIRFSNSFKESDLNWDKVLYFSENDFSSFLYSTLAEEQLLSSLILNWTGSKNAFPIKNEQVWIQIKKAMLLARDVLNTRNYFSKRWFTNSINFLKYIKNISIPEKINKDILITASGPSLKNSINFIKENREKFFLICLSSSLSVLIFHKIKPDVVLSTDGGYWAKKHLEIAANYPDFLKKTIFALTDESNVSKTILKNFNILPLCYKNSIGETLFKKMNIPFLYAQRNGTVSGTAAILAYSLTNKNIYFCGLDLCSSKGFNHTMPNCLAKINQAKENKINSREKAVTFSRFNGEGSLEIYRNWFKNLKPDVSKRIKRISNNYKYEYDIKPIQDLSWDEIDLSPEKAETKISTDIINLDKNMIKSLVHKLILSDTFNSEIFPLESLLIFREIDSSKRKELEEKIKAKKDELTIKIEHLLT